LSALIERSEGYAASGGDMPVTNQLQETSAVTESRSQPPEEGEGGRVNRLTDGGFEEVEGFRLIELAEAAEANLFQTPQITGLPDVGEASFGEARPVPENVHGVDNRVRVEDTTAYPWRVNCSLLITAADNSRWVGTAWFISPRTLITAGHCVHIKNNPIAARNGWVKSIQVMPGRDGTSLPFGSVTSTVFRSVSGWTQGGDSNFDYGAIILPTPLGAKVGWLGLGVYTDDDLRTVVGNISGYPADKVGAEEGTQWFHANRIADLDGRKVFYDIDTVGGQSGSAVYRASGDQRFAFGVHAYGGATTNSGVRITTEVFNNMVSWKA
jgi:V8-like Glu-specific endopeptidase